MKRILNVIVVLALVAATCILPAADYSDEDFSLSDLIVTAYSDRAGLDDDSLAELETAYSELEAVSSASELVSGLPSGLVSLHLFNVTIVGNTGEYIDSGGTITVTMDVFTPNSDIYVLARVDGEWVIINSKVQSVDGNNVGVLVELVDTDCPLLVAVRESGEDDENEGSGDGMKETDTEEDTISSVPDTVEEEADSSSVLYIVIGIGCIVIAVILLILIVSKRRK